MAEATLHNTADTCVEEIHVGMLLVSAGTQIPCLGTQCCHGMIQSVSFILSQMRFVLLTD